MQQPRQGSRGPWTGVGWLGFDAPILAALLELGPQVRRALLQLATRPGRQQGVVDALKELWPEEAPGSTVMDELGRREA